MNAMAGREPTRPAADAGSGRSRGSGRKPSGGRDVLVLTALTAGALGYAWWVRGERHLTAETGAGYLLGIAGSVLMLVMLLYPLRKRIPALRGIGTIPAWFRLHMLLGILGPALVILHSNFRLGSLNSRVALFAMLIVAGSGYLGRFLYVRIHRSLGGQRRLLSDFTMAAAGEVPALGAAGLDPQMLAGYQARRLPDRPRLMGVLLRFFTGPLSRRRLRRSALKSIRRDAGKEAVQAAIAPLDGYLAALARAEALLLYERLFSLWHILHLPLFVILILAAILHVVAVHLY